MIARSRGASLYFESAGTGEAVLLVMGLGMAGTGWWRTVPVLAERLRVLTFDNRGAGRSECTPGPYTIAQMADDAVAVLDAAGEQSAHVYGISMGGMIAQEVALRHPERVRRLVLGASTPGGARHELPDEATLTFVRRRESLPTEEAVWASVPYNYARATRTRHGGRIAEDVAQRLRFPPDPEGYRAQLAAAFGHNAFARLRDVAAPTLVVHGGEDRMVPVSNGRLLAERIPGARLRVFTRAAHLYPTDEPRSADEVLRFLVARRTPKQPRTAREARA